MILCDETDIRPDHVTAGHKLEEKNMEKPLFTKGISDVNP